MRRLFFLFISAFQTLLLALAALGLILLAMGLYAYSAATDRADLSIGPGQGWGRLLDREAMALYSELERRAEEINTPISTDSRMTPFEIESGEAAYSIGLRLQDQGLISDAGLFGQLLSYNGIDTRLQAGNYQLRRNMSMKEIATVLYQGYASRNVITVFPGWRLEQVATQLARNGTMDGTEFLRLATEGTVINHPLLADRPPGASYEGYFMPGTYHLPDNPTPEHLIARMVDNMARHLPPNVLELARQRGLTFHQVLTIASIIERETAQPDEKPLVASVYLNRLSPTSPIAYLQADPTVQYAMGYQAATDQWWKSPVSLDEYSQVDSPYNTYLYPGLPPGPIANPSLESIIAVLNPAQTDYLFFVCARPGCEDGRHVFARSYDEHLQNVAVYYGQ